MMKQMYVLLLFVAATLLQAQVNTPAPSPLAKVMQVVGVTEVEITYSRPGIKGRDIFGGLVPYDKVWRTGANASTQISFSSDVELEGKTVPAGTYSLYTIPNPDSWEIIINKKLDSGQRHQASEDLLRFTVAPASFPRSVERFTISVEDMTDNGATIFLRWHKTEVPIRITVPTETLVLESINEFMKGDNSEDAGGWYQAGRYYYENEIDMEKALEMVNKSLSINPDPFWVLRTKALILAKLDRKEEAIEAAKMSMEKARAAGNMQYVRFNQDSIEEWSK